MEVAPNEQAPYTLKKYKQFLVVGNMTRPLKSVKQMYTQQRDYLINPIKQPTLLS